MAHDINYSNERHSVFVVGEPAWHRLGQRVEEAVTSEEAMELANLNYDVELQPVFLSDGTIVEGKKSPVRTDTNIPLGIVGNRYNVLQNKDAFGFFDDVVGAGEAMYHTAGALGNGEKIWMLAKLPKTLLIKREDAVEQFLVLVNSHDGSSPIKMYYTPIRVVCQNTLTMSLRDSKQGISIRHTGSINNKISEARRILGLSLEFSREFEVLANMFAEKSMNVTSIDAYFDMVLGSSGEEEEKTAITNKKNKLLRLFEHGRGNETQSIRHTLWTAYNAVTEYADYEKTVKGEKENHSKRIESMWFGSGADMKMRAFDIAKNLVTV